jgi:intracellular sulfur oxidation DsrE/DsrF family protein
MKHYASLFLLAASISMTSIAQAEYVQPNIQHDPYGMQRVAYQMNTADAAEQLQIIKYANNHIQTVGKPNMELQVVIFGAGISLLQSDDEKLNKAIDALRAEGVKIAICNNTLRNKNIDWKSLRGVKEADIVPGGVAELAFLQQRGFAYIKP